MLFEGKCIKVSVFGQSHAPAVGAVISGLPAGIPVDMDELQSFMARRAPGQGRHTTQRKEKDTPEFVSGMNGGRTCGVPVCLIIRNEDTRSGDYSGLEKVPRPSHADWPASVKYGKDHDIRGGGAFSARLTAPLCAVGGIAIQMLNRHGIYIGAHISAAGSVRDVPFDPVNVCRDDLEAVKKNPFPVIDQAACERMLAEIGKAAAEGDSIGGTVECAAVGLPAGIGGPLFQGLECGLAAAVMAIPAVRGVEFGAGFRAAEMRGSEHNDPYIIRDGAVKTETNNAGGITGGMTTGMPLILRAAFKPTPSIAKEQRSVDLERMEETVLAVRGRHDPCVVPRAVPVVEAVTALVLLDRIMAERGSDRL